MESNVVTSDQLAAWLLLQLAEQGRPVEIASQFLASWLMSSEAPAGALDDVQGFLNELKQIKERTILLCLDASEIWEGLLPGGPGNSLPMNFNIVSTEEWAKLHDATRDAETFKLIFDTFSEDITDEERASRTGEILVNRGYVEMPKKVDPYTYSLSIIIDPRVRHDNTTDRMSDAEMVHVESPLNLAEEVWRKIDMLDQRNVWPAEELSGWITHHESGKHFIMQFDQATGIQALEEAQVKLSLDLSDEFQSIQDEMAIAGQEYVVGNPRFS